MQRSAGETTISSFFATLAESLSEDGNYANGTTVVTDGNSSL